MSSFSGKLKEFPHISVDRFDGRNLASTAYFLSHAHSDHMVGLSSPQFLDHLESNSGVYLYCSVITARFLQASIRHRPLSPFLRPLPPDEPVIVTIPTVANEPHHSLTVTLIPAGHCPGSVMLLLEGRGGTVLYTGDFRLGVGESNQLRALHNPDGSVKTLHSLHIDTTFCHRRVLSFPSRHDSAQAVGDLVEEWLAKGNNHLIHLLCPAKYGYEFVYRSLQERFNMRIHVSRWKYRMYDTVPEIQDSLTTDATETWIHACDWRSEESSTLCSGGSGGTSGGGDGAGGGVACKRQLPCRCVPYGVDTEPNIRVIKPSALFYTTYQTHKEICQVSEGGSWCRVLLSMHASCAEVLDMVAYLRPRKVYPNVIPANSSKEEVLSLLHEALSQSGDHYSIEYDGRGGGAGAVPYRRLLPPSCDVVDSPVPIAEETLGSFKRQLPPPSHGSPSKRRRHSDSGSMRQDALLLTLPNPRGNMKGSLSLEGEPQQPEPGGDGGSSIDGLSPSFSSHSSPMSAPISPLLPPKVSPAELLLNSGVGAEDLSSDSALGTGAKAGEWCRGSSSQDSECSSVFSDDNDQALMSSAVASTADVNGVMAAARAGMTGREGSIGGPGFMRSLTRESSVMSEGGESVCSLPADDKAAGKRRRMWYKHHHFSTPVTDDVQQHDAFPLHHNSNKNNNIQSDGGGLGVHKRLTLRSSSLPDHTSYTASFGRAAGGRSSQLLLTCHSLLQPPPIPCHSPPLPLITVSSPATSDDAAADVRGSSEDADNLIMDSTESRSGSLDTVVDVVSYTNSHRNLNGSARDHHLVQQQDLRNALDYSRKASTSSDSQANNNTARNTCNTINDSGFSSAVTTINGSDSWDSGDIDIASAGRNSSNNNSTSPCPATSRPTVIRTAVTTVSSSRPGCDNEGSQSVSIDTAVGDIIKHDRIGAIDFSSCSNSSNSIADSALDMTQQQQEQQHQRLLSNKQQQQHQQFLNDNQQQLDDKLLLVGCGSLSSATAPDGAAVAGSIRPPAVARSSCLKTARRTATDRLEVVSLDQQQL